MKPVIGLFFRTPVLTLVFDTVRCVLFSIFIEDPAPAAPKLDDEERDVEEEPIPIWPFGFMTDSLRVFFTLMLLVNRSSVHSPVFLSMISTHSLVYFFWLPLNSVLGTPDPSKWGTVTFTWLFVPTSTVASLFRSTLAGLKSSGRGGREREREMKRNWKHFQETQTIYPTHI